MSGIWEQLSQQWRPRNAGGPASFAAWREAMAGFLAEKGITPLRFSHFGVVVAETETVLGDIARALGAPVGPAGQAWVEGYRVWVTRCELEGGELELVEPAGESPFLEFLNTYGPGLHHLAFYVEDIAGCIDALAAAGENLLDKTPRTGSHGRIAFAAPVRFSPICLELCQSNDRILNGEEQ